MSENVDHRVYGSEFEYGVLFDEHYYVPNDFFLNLPNGLSKSISDMRKNGSRIYRDCDHVEYATPETGTIDDFVSAELAGEEIVIEGLLNASKLADDKSFRVHLRAIDAHGGHYGSHFSFNVLNTLRFDNIDGVNRERIVHTLAAFNAVRTALLGSGYYDTKSQKWKLSQRMSAGLTLERSVCHNGLRPLVDTRNESFADDAYRRLHDSSMDPSITIWSLRTKVGLTSAYLRMVENGVDLRDLYLADPVQSAVSINDDTSLKKLILLENGSKLTALNHLEQICYRIKRFHEDGNFIPSDEMEVVNDVHNVVISAQRDINVLFDRSDWYTRMVTAKRIAEKKAKSKNHHKLLAKADYVYDLRAMKAAGTDKIVVGVGQQQREAERVAAINHNKVTLLRSEPPTSSRARLRGRLIEAAEMPDVNAKYGYIKQCTWDELKYAVLQDPFEFPHPRMITLNRLSERIISMAGLSI